MEPTQSQQEILNSDVGEDQKIDKLIENKVESNAQSVDPSDIAAGMFGMYHIKAKQLIENLSGNSIKRVFKKVLFEPLEETNLKLKPGKESDLYHMVDSMFQAKFMLLFQANFDALLREKQSVENALHEANEPVKSSN